jgi:hypothetical protein
MNRRDWLAASAALLQARRRLPAELGDATIRARAGDSDIEITTTARLAGAIHSVRWGGREFIDSADHGRQLQSAANFDGPDTGGRIFDETYNPTEAGSRRDGAGPTSSSRLEAIETGDAWLATRNRPAFWLAPGETSGSHPAFNTSIVSDHLITKRVRIGLPGLPHAIGYDVTYTLPDTARHTVGTFEALTGYMPPEFDRFETLDPATGRLAPIDHGPGEQPRPLVFSVAGSTHAMGCVALAASPEGLSGPTYGRWRFEAERVVKWNAVYRLSREAGLPTGDYAFRLVVAVGTREDVRATLVEALRRG